ncbi:SDR family oxidoreductase [Actinoplanes sp. N902-109]|uniref:SDR family oxidoreductase n=1 Tax=Actinoplanes sp. (strain N902-109) TaxID=649831 RepID=UPI0003293F1A|nr:NAD(P)H-binding protein [Actinoplanes sp. N902-109]AGL16203.1 NmrA family protein [Actinoplanes sp. N902-109]
MIVVTGATGNIGRPLTQTLAAAGEAVTTVSRHAAHIPGVRHVVADLADPASLKPALDGAKALFLLLSGDLHAAESRPEDIVAEAAAQGVEKIVLLSTLGVVTRPFGTTRIKMRSLEDDVQKSGMDWAILRPGGFDSNALWWADSIRQHRMVAAPFGDVGVPIVDPADIAEVAAACLTDDRHSSSIFALTGPAVITPREQTQAIATALGEPVRFQELSRAEALAGMAQSMPEELANDTLDIIGAPNAAELRISPDIEHVLGRAPRSFADWAARNLEAFR